MAQQYSQTITQKLSDACVVDLTPPTFSGIASIVTEVNGALRANWSLATDSSTPVRYNVYIALGVVSAAALFVDSNIAVIAKHGSTSEKIFTLGDKTTYLFKGLTYTMGVRAFDSLGNMETNTAILTASPIGYADIPSVFQNEVNQLEVEVDTLQATNIALASVASDIINSTDQLKLLDLSLGSDIDGKISDEEEITATVEDQSEV